MRRFIASFLCAALLTLTIPAAPAVATADKQLQNLKGSVSYRTAGGAMSPVALHGSVTLGDNYSAATQANSLGAIVLPDSSRVILGSSTNVKLVSFNQSAIASANFIVIGKVRFKVEHPRGAKANYTFQTPTAQIAVRGTEGDISADPASGNVQINVYQLSDPSLPVQVTLTNGQVFTLVAGQSLTVTAAGGVISATVSSVSQSAFTPFQEFGAPANATSYGITSTLADVTTTTITTTAAAAAGIGTLTTIAGAILGTIVVNTIVHTVENTFGSHPSGSAPAPAASPSVPIVIH